MRQPTPAELEIINKLLPESGEPLTDRDIIVETIVATDNLISRSKSKWHKDALAQLAELAIGISFTADHDWSNVDKTMGRVFAAKVVRCDSAPADLLDRCGEKTNNLQAIKDDGGYFTLEFDVFLDLNSLAARAIRYGIISAVSIGGFDYTDVHCPLCNTSFFDKQCPHGVPDSWYCEDEDMAPYYERKDVIDLGEISAVLIGNIPGAGIKRKT